MIISESQAQGLVSLEDATEAIAATFIAMAQGKARNCPVVREVAGHADAVYGAKAGGDISALFLGLKAAGYRPHNRPRGLTNRQSSTLMFDPETGRASGLVSANYLTGARTGARTGADTSGKQELDPALVAAARLFLDEATQAISVGECPHAFAQGLIGAADLTALGAVLGGHAEGRRSEAGIALFDGIGVVVDDGGFAEPKKRLADPGRF